MNTNEIEVLLKKFMEGETDLGEEKILHDFFLNNEIPAHLKFYQEYFIHARTAHEEQISPDFEQRLNLGLTREEPEIPVLPVRNINNRFLFWSSIAAGVLLLVGLFFTFQHDFVNTNNNETLLAEREIAYHETKDALMLVSVNLNTGLQQIERLQALDKVLNTMQTFSKFYQYQSLIINPDIDKNLSTKLNKP